ncbi:MAG TPA: hypothetical protein VMH01_04185 [Puia sp.]|nr:hypothetical protein [Puia sp.]
MKQASVKKEKRNIAITRIKIQKIAAQLSPVSAFVDYFSIPVNIGDYLKK